MIQKKICLLGGFAVGKTSLVSRFVHSIFSDKYLTTVGVKIEKKSLTLEKGALDLVVWDIYGEDDFQKVRMSYLRGASGYLLVVDGTRKSTLDTALALHEAAGQTIGKVPCVLVINKADLASIWEIDQATVTRLLQAGWRVMQTSAKSGEGVEEVFATLGRAMLDE
jgi:small GTP-binding protein